MELAFWTPYYEFAFKFRNVKVCIEHETGTLIVKGVPIPLDGIASINIYHNDVFKLLWKNPIYQVKE